MTQISNLTVTEEAGVRFVDFSNRASGAVLDAPNLTARFF